MRFWIMDQKQNLKKNQTKNPSECSFYEATASINSSIC